MNDLTLIYVSANLIPEFTQAKILNRHFKIFTQYSVIRIVQGENYPKVGSSPYNYYKQFLEGCYQAHTEFVATFEDDTLYNAEHFTKRPAEGFNYAYNTNAWLGSNKVFWRSPNMNSFGFYISRRKALIKLLENRFKHFPAPPSVDIQRHFHEPGILTCDGLVKVDTFATTEPIVAFEHRGTLSGKRKRFGNSGIPELDPYGSAKDLYKHYWD